MALARCVTKGDGFILIALKTTCQVVSRPAITRTRASWVLGKAQMYEQHTLTGKTITPHNAGESPSFHFIKLTQDSQSTLMAHMRSNATACVTQTCHEQKQGFEVKEEILCKT